MFKVIGNGTIGKCLEEELDGTDSLEICFVEKSTTH